VSQERLALWGRRTVVRTYLPKGVWTVALSEKDELVPFANEALRLVEVDGEASVAQDTNRDQRACHVGNQMNGTSLWWKVVEAGNIEIGFMCRVHDRAIGTCHWDRVRCWTNVLDGTVPATEVTGRSGVGIAW